MARGALPDSHPLHLGMPGMHGSVSAVTALQKSDLHHRPRRPVRRPGHRPAVDLRSRGQGHPRRHRPGRDQQEPQGRRADRRRLQGRHRRSHRGRRRRHRRRPCGRLRGLARAYAGAGRRPSRSATRRRRTARSPRSTSSSGSAPSPDPRPSTSPASASTRCGPRSSSSTSGPTPGSTPAASGRWGTPSRPPWAPRSASPTGTVWAIDGDGCFQMTNQELATCVINDIPIKVAVINNCSLGMVRQWQSLFYNERYSNTDLHTSVGAPGARLRQARRGLRLCRAALRAARGRRRDDPRGDGGHRPAGRRRLRRPPGRDGVADGRRRREQRRHPGRPGHRAAVGPRGVRRGRAGPRR